MAKRGKQQELRIRRRNARRERRRLAREAARRPQSADGVPHQDVSTEDSGDDQVAGTQDSGVIWGRVELCVDGFGDPISIYSACHDAPKRTLRRQVGLRDMPRELRDLIYDFWVSSVLEPNDLKPLRGPSVIAPSRSALGLLHSNKQIREEVEMRFGLALKGQHLCFLSVTKLYFFLRDLSPSVTHEITSVWVVYNALVAVFDPPEIPNATDWVQFDGQPFTTPQAVIETGPYYAHDAFLLLDTRCPRLERIYLERCNDVSDRFDLTSLVAAYPGIWALEGVLTHVKLVCMIEGYRGRLHLYHHLVQRRARDRGTLTGDAEFYRRHDSYEVTAPRRAIPLALLEETRPEGEWSAPWQ
ncbi:MAG: hypothetical protein Q9187_002113 [Circinaria calcarea]